MAEEAAEITEEETVEAAIRAGEEAAGNDFKLKNEKAAEEVAKLCEELEAAEAAMNLSDRTRLRIRSDRLGLESVVLVAGKLTYQDVNVPRGVAFNLCTMLGAYRLSQDAQVRGSLQGGGGQRQRFGSRHQRRCGKRRRRPRLGGARDHRAARSERRRLAALKRASGPRAARGVPFDGSVYRDAGLFYSMISGQVAVGPNRGFPGVLYWVM